MAQHQEGDGFNAAEADYLLHRAMTQLGMANRATSEEVALIHFRMSSHYAERAKALLDARCTRRHRPALFVVPQQARQ